MKQKPKAPGIPVAAHDTARHEISSVLAEGPHTAKEISSLVRMSEKEVYGHLEHIRKTLAQAGGHLTVAPAECRKCGFAFSKRERLRKPGKCPVCRGESIQEPRFSIEV